MPPGRAHALPSGMTRRLRSLLFVPGNRSDLAAKAPRSGPDGVVLDLEDAVPPGDKADARAAVADVVGPLSAEVPVYVRVNPPGTPWYEGDMAALPAGITGVVVPKLESLSQLSEVSGSIGAAGIVAGLETVRGVMDAREFLRPPVTACYFGAEDYIYDLGGVRTDDNAEVASPRALVAAAARLGGVTALDMVTLDFGDAERFDREAHEARALGYRGKLCIHPAQVGLANAAFLPTDQEVETARNLLAAFAEAGGATIAFEGQMVDEVVAARARAVLAAVDGS
jgi:citrate lyase subunit beta / citryl-CoA lyase